MLIKYVALAVVLFLSVLGLAELMHGINLRVTSPRRKAVTYSVVFLKGEDAEEQLAFAIEQQKWLGKAYSDYIIAVNSGISEKSDKACRYLAEKNGADYCSLYDLKGKVESLK
ncbi:MAG: hypothetical protein U0K70_03410 [Acutalibacteraceae bacterium]|mgnify:CR=1 FL=1|nr:hypothetical protein [Acutalibacteraceae bacterium]